MVGLKEKATKKISSENNDHDVIPGGPRFPGRRTNPALRLHKDTVDQIVLVLCTGLWHLFVKNIRECLLVASIAQNQQRI